MASPIPGRSIGVIGPPDIFRDGSIPAQESPGRKLLIRGWALFTVAFSATYLLWRLSGTVNLDWWWIALPLLIAEIHNAFGLVLYTIALWSLDSEPPPTIADPALRVAVLIPTYNEPADVLLPTIAAAISLRPRHETWVLDDGRRDEVRRLAEQLGASYLTRPDNRHAKAGNLNHALASIDAEVIAVLDADQVPTARFLTALLPYLADPRVAFAQSPQDFYNLASFEHERRWNGELFNEEAVFYRVIAPAKTRWSAPFWCGTGALVRVAALRSVGGVSTDSVTEDIQTTIRMYRAGWTGTYHNEVLVHGLAPDDAASYMLQRHRWALGAMQVLRGENPLFGKGLSIGQRIAFLTTLFGWFDSWRTFAYMVIPLAVVATGAVPINAPGEIFGPFFGATLALQFVALRLLARGHYPPMLSLLFEVLRMPAVLPATIAGLLRQRNVAFKVTPKGRARRGRGSVPVPILLSVLAAATSLGLAWFAATLFGLTPVTYSAPWAAIGAAFFMSVNLALLLSAIGRIRSSRFAGNRRAGTRLPVHIPTTVDGRAGQLEDLSLTGARVLLDDSFEARRGQVTLGLVIPRERLEVASVVKRRITRENGGIELGLEFDPGQEETIARLAVFVFHAGSPRKTHRSSSGEAEQASGRSVA
jgi:cellulose synthase/poly-beta-1,6-N-acetylglucosamine synthase-like glycosyltransferase